jgi:hypothetical protein
MTMQISGVNAAYLKKEFIVPKMYEIMNPYLVGLDLLPKVKTDSRSVRIRKDSYSDSTDPKLVTMPLKTDSSTFPYVDISVTTIDSAILQTKGIALKIDRDAINFADGIDYIQRAYRRAAFWLASAFNTEVLSAITAGATTPTWTPTAVWSAAGATPIDDLIALSEQMEREGYSYRMTDVYVNKTNYYEMLRYLAGADIGDLKQQNIYGIPFTNQPVINLPVIQAEVRSLLSGVDEGYVLAMDRNNPCGTIFYYTDPAFATKNPGYQIAVSGGGNRQMNVGDLGFNFHQYQEDDTHNIVMQFWWDTATKVIEAYAALYDSGI